MAKCPYCNSPVQFEDFDRYFETFEDCGDHIVATGIFDCQCGENLKVKAVFNWDECFEIV